MPSHPLFRGTKLYEKLISNSCYNGGEQGGEQGGVYLTELLQQYEEEF